MNTHPEIKAKGKPEWTTLLDHLNHVLAATVKFASFTDHDTRLARLGAIFHDIGKVHPVFQKQLSGDRPHQPFRHEIASLFFLPLIKEGDRAIIIEMIIAHHKSAVNDMKRRGILDLIDDEPENLEYHLGDWEEWSPIALDILACFDIDVRPITKEEARASYHEVIDFCEYKTSQRGYSEWRGLLMGGDHFASAMIHKTYEKLHNLFQKPVLSFFNRQHPLYPLSYYSSESERPHTMVVASTGAGKTDYLFRRCRGRVFYTLPFQASINAMYARLSHDLAKTNPDLNIKILHAASSLVEQGDGGREDIILQKHIGSAIKVLTPYQLAGIAFGSKGYEAMILDLKDTDVILDEVHTYSDISQAIVLKVVSVLKEIGCRLHIGTATMPTLLYERIKEMLGAENVLETKMTTEELNKYDRHEVRKIENWDLALPLIRKGIQDDQKILIVCNRIMKAQYVYGLLRKAYPQVPALLLHSRYKRKDRKEREKDLIGLDADGQTTFQFNTSEKACIVVSTQVVEVSIDISFDLMITECAPLDSLIQRFGRINRKRNKNTIGKTKPVYVIAPPDDEKEALPYDLEILNRSYEALPDRKILHERTLQQKIDTVFTEIDFLKIEEQSVFKENGKWSIPPLANGNAWLVKILNIDSVSCIIEDDLGTYQKARFEKRAALEISVPYYAVQKYPMEESGNHPFILPAHTYDSDLGLMIERLKDTGFNQQTQFI